MTQIKVDDIADAAGTGAPDFADGLTVAGSAISTLNTFEYYSTGTEPSTPNDGAIWWDTGNDKVFMFIADEWKEVELGASAGAASWTVDLSNVTYDSVSLDVSSQDTAPLGLAFNTDGTKMYIAGTGGDSVFQYSLSTGFDLSTASYDSVSFSVSSQTTGPQGITFNTDGTKMYIVDTTQDSIFQYSLSTAFDLSTASYDSVSFSVASQDNTPLDLAFNTDGTKVYMVGVDNQAVYQYSLSTAFDLSTISYDSVSFSVGSQETSPSGMAFNTDGTKMYVTGYAGDNIYQYSLSTGFDLSTASYDSVSFDVSSQEAAPRDLAFSADGTKVYVVGSSDAIHQYSTGL